MKNRVISIIIILAMMLGTYTVAVAADTGGKATRSSLKSYGSIEYHNGNDKVVFNSEDLYMLADQIDQVKLEVANQLEAMNTYFTAGEGISLNSNKDISITHARPFGAEYVDPVNVNFDTLMEGIAASQSVSQDVTSYGYAAGTKLYINKSGSLTTDGSAEGAEQISVVAATAENLSAGTAAWVNGELILGTGGDNKTYFEKGGGSGSVDDDTEALKRIEGIRIGNESKVYVAPEDMTDVILVFFGVKKHQLTFASDEVIPYKEIYHKVRSKQREGFTDVVCTMYFIPKLPKGTGVNVPADSVDYRSYLVRVKEPNHKGGQITKEDISGSNYFAKTDMKDVLLLQRSDNSDPVPAFEPAPGKPIVGFKKIAEFRHQYGFGYPQGNGIAGNLVHYYSLYYIPNMPAGTTISKHNGGVLFY